MHTLAELAAELCRTPLYVRGLQKRFELPVLETYSNSYLAFLRTVVWLRMHDVAEETLRDLWKLEKKLLQLLHADSTGSATGFWINAAVHGSRHRRRRLLLSNYDPGVPLDSRSVQPGLNISDKAAELFGGREMGEDELRVLEECRQLTRRIRGEALAQVPQLRRAASWVARWP